MLRACGCTGELYEGAKDMIDLRAQLAKAVAMEAKQINNSRIEQALAEELVKITDADLPRQIVQEVGTSLALGGSVAMLQLGKRS